MVCTCTSCSIARCEQQREQQQRQQQREQLEREQQQRGQQQRGQQQREQQEREQQQRWQQQRPVSSGGGLGLILILVLIIIFTHGRWSSYLSRWSSSLSSSSPTTGLFTLGQLRMGDCITGSNLNLREDTAWPDQTDVVPCNQSHTGEVFYANDSYWPAGDEFPGTAAVAATAGNVCETQFQAYDGISLRSSKYMFAGIDPSTSVWAGGYREIVCVAFLPDGDGTAVQSLSGTIKGSNE